MAGDRDEVESQGLVAGAMAGKVNEDGVYGDNRRKAGTKTWARDLVWGHHGVGSLEARHCIVEQIFSTFDHVVGGEHMTLLRLLALPSKPSNFPALVLSSSAPKIVYHAHIHLGHRLKKSKSTNSNDSIIRRNVIAH